MDVDEEEKVTKNEAELVGELYKASLTKLFSGRYEVMVRAEDETSLNFTELIRLLVKTVRNVSQKILDLEDNLDHSKRGKSEGQ